jgi:predicted kinase
MNELPVLVVVHGLPCSGKTTVARRIKQQFGLPFFEKDGVKERLFDSLGWSDVGWSRKLSQASKAVLYYVIEEEIKSGRSLGVECNFWPPEDNEHFKAIASRVPHMTLQILCWAPGEELVNRFLGRTGLRHPGHGDQTLLEEIQKKLLQGKVEPLDIGGELIELETTWIDEIDYAGLFEKIRAHAPRLVSR